MEAIQSTAYCCGIAGIMGFKRDFHKASIQMGSRLMAKIKRIDPDQLVTDCLSCRLQFNQMSAYPVQHPIETLSQAYQDAETK
jgi:glycerol-3-phosphate dehydrogenase subunit C